MSNNRNGLKTFKRAPSSINSLVRNNRNQNTLRLNIMQQYRQVSQTIIIHMTINNIAASMYTKYKLPRETEVEYHKIKVQ